LRATLLKQEGDDFLDAALVDGIVGDQYHIGPFARQDGKRAVKIIGGARFDGCEHQSQPAPRSGAVRDSPHWKRYRDSTAKRFAMPME
jgi:hypothetical protein